MHVYGGDPRLHDIDLVRFHYAIYIHKFCINNITLKLYHKYYFGHDVLYAVDRIIERRKKSEAIMYAVARNVCYFKDGSI